MTARQLYVRNPKDCETDRLLETIHLKIPQNQMDYLRDNKEMNRYELYKALKKHFKRNINKLQFNTILASVRGDEILVKQIPPSKKVNIPRPDVPHYPNIQWVTQQGVWAVRFKKGNKVNHIGRF